MNRGQLIAAVYQAMGDPLAYYAIGREILATGDEATILAFFQAAMVQAERNGRF